jgi:hypothetical protein
MRLPDSDSLSILTDEHGNAPPLVITKTMLPGFFDTEQKQIHQYVTDQQTDDDAEDPPDLYFVESSCSTRTPKP